MARLSPVLTVCAALALPFGCGDSSEATSLSGSGPTASSTAGNSSSSGDAGSSSDASGSETGSDTSAGPGDGDGDGDSPACGDGNIDPNEQCDGVDLGGLTCATLGYDGGSLACDPMTCTYDTSNCETGGPTSGGE
ncbi:MAG: hypothetical protein KC468_12645 [Myxococcales bacterium]|nr:hypothetical protein [Myxococcales bacterium]